MITLDLNKESAPGVLLDLSKAVPQMKNLKGVLNWDEHPLHKDCTANGYDLDIFIFCLNAQGKLTSATDVVYFKNKSHPSGAITVPVDNQTGGGDDDEFFTMALERLPAGYSRFDVFVFIHEAEQRGQNFGMVANAHFDLIDADTDNTEVRYNLTQNFSTETCIHVASIIPAGDHVDVQPVGEGAVADPNQVASAYM